MAHSVNAKSTTKPRVGWKLLLMAVVTPLIYGGLMEAGLAEETTRTWHDFQLKLFDSREFINSTVSAQHGGLPGTNKPYDAQKVSDELVQMIFAELRDQSRVHPETALATLGALAGFSVQMSLRKTLVKPGKMPEDKAFVIVKTKNGESFYLESVREVFQLLHSFRSMRRIEARRT